MKSKAPFTVPRTLRMALVAIAAFALVLPCSGAAPQPTRIEGTDGHASAVAQSLQRLYGAEQPQLFWSDPGQANVALDLLRTAPAHGLDRSHYDVDALSRRHAQMQPADAEGFDKALSQAMLRFLTDLHFGRVKPDFQLSPSEQRLQQFDVVEHLRQALAQQRLTEAVAAAAPTIPLYKRVQATLQQYRQLAAQAPAWSAPPGLPADGKLIAGNTYPGLHLLRQRLQLLGDLDGDEASLDRPSDELKLAIKRFQSRHAIAETGVPGRETVAALNVPLGHRVRQLELTLERLRWMPPLRPGRIIVVNVAAYRLWAFDTAAGATGEPFDMRVIVGKAARTQTPLFIGQMSHLEFNPYWNVPRSIAVGEIAPKLARNPAYLAQNQMELVSQAGQVVDGTPAAAAAGLRNGTLRVRQRPGAHNVLGAVKFAMPNPMSIFLHSTSAKELFGKSRRDLSHGCIRVERPAQLAGFVLGDQPQWSAEKIDAAMAPGATRTVRLGQVIPVVLFYATAATDRAGRALFADDIYRRDDTLAQALSAR